PAAGRREVRPVAARGGRHGGDHRSGAGRHGRRDRAGGLPRRRRAAACPDRHGVLLQVGGRWMTVPNFFAAKVADALPDVLRKTADSLLGTLKEVDPEAAGWVTDARRRQETKPSVVVVGETKRGKSSLINALLASPGLSPVDADVATATYLVFDHAEQWRAQACYPGRQPVPFEVSELPMWTSAAHELPAGQVPPRYVEVAGP